jgi:hypothetical protein
MLMRRGRGPTVAVGTLNLAGSTARYVLRLALAGGRRDADLRALGHWARVHRYAFAPRRVLARYR